MIVKLALLPLICLLPTFLLSDFVNDIESHFCSVYAQLAMLLLSYFSFYDVLLPAVNSTLLNKDCFIFLNSFQFCYFLYLFRGTIL